MNTDSTYILPTSIVSTHLKCFSNRRNNKANNPNCQTVKFLYKNRAIRLHLTIAITVQFFRRKDRTQSCLFRETHENNEIVRLVGEEEGQQSRDIVKKVRLGKDRRREENTSKLLKQLGESA